MAVRSLPRGFLPALVPSLALAGCATCNEHPNACKAVVAAVVIGTVIAAQQRHAAAPSGCVGYYLSQGDTLAQAEQACR